jgi:hypothetical protein
VPAGAIEHEHGMHIGRQGGGKACEEQVHGRGIDGRQHEGEVVARGGPDGREDVGPLIAALAQTRRALALGPPAMADPALVADPRLVLKPQLEALVGLRRGGGRQRVAKPLFMKRSCALSSRWGCAGRAFWREKPMRYSTRVRLDG